MRVLLDEDVPVPLVELLRHILDGHQVDHVYDLHWGGKTDRDLYKDARARGYEVVLTNNLKQLQDPDECAAIRRSGVHHVSYEIDNGLQGLALASGAICAAMRRVLEELAGRPKQHLVRIAGLSGSKSRFTISDPSTDPPSPYW